MSKTVSLPRSAGARRAVRLESHPTALALAARGPTPAPVELGLADFRALALAAGADDAGAISLEHPDLGEERAHAERALPGARTLISIVMRMHADDVRSPARSVANLEFHRTGHATDDVAHRLATALSERGHRAVNPAMAFPMEMDDFPNRTWVISHKKVAVVAELGKMGLHRNVIHPRFGSFVLLGTVITTAGLTERPAPLTFDPCVSCKLCVAACPVGAIESDGIFRFSACYDHNYRDFMTGFGDVLENVAESRNRHELRERLSIAESASIWQSLAYQPNYKAAHCIAVCPAGEDHLGSFIADRKGHLDAVVRPLTERAEPVYVVAGSDAGAHVTRRFPKKKLRVVRSSLRAATASAFFAALPLVFQRGPARGVLARYHFDLSGAEPVQATVTIDDGALEVSAGLSGEADVEIACDGALWLDIVAKKRSPVFAVITGKLRVSGDRSLLDRFAACFPR